MDSGGFGRLLNSGHIPGVTIAYRLRSRYGLLLKDKPRVQLPYGESQSPIGSGPDMDPGVQLDHTGHLHPGGSQSPIGSGPDMDRGQRTILQMSGF